MALAHLLLQQAALLAEHQSTLCKANGNLPLLLMHLPVLFKYFILAALPSETAALLVVVWDAENEE